MPGPNDIWPWLQSILQNQGAGPPGQPAAPAAPMQNFGNFNPPQGPGPGNVAAVDLSDDHGTGPPAVMSPAEMAAAQAAAQPPLQAQPQPQPAPNGPAIYPHMPWPGSPPPQTYPHMPWPPNADNSHMPWPDTGAPTGSPSATPKPAGPLASPGGVGAPMKRTPGAPNLGYYQGNNNRFVQVDRPNASAAGGFGRGGAPQMTALNLAGLFGGRQPAAAPAVNPNVPAANAQPVSMVNGPTPVGQGLNPSGNLALAGGNSPGPNQFSSVPVPYPPSMPGDIRNQRVANAVRNPNWWQNL